VTRLHLDYETASEVNIKTAGAHKYASDPSTRILMLGWAIDDDPVELWEAHKGPAPARLTDALRSPHVRKHAFNAQFERLITRYCLGVEVPPEQWRCTMVESYYLGFAGGLDKTLGAVGLEGKDKRGGQLINVFCTPAPKNHKAAWYDWANRPAEWEEFCDYCRQDVHVERRLRHWMQQFPAMSDWDYAQWCADQRINDRGVPMDTDFAASAIELWDIERQALTRELQDLTGLPRVTRGPFMEWLQTNTGAALENLRKDYLAAELKHGRLPDAARPAVELWAQKEAKATAKYNAVINASMPDDRARGMFQYKGASRTDRVGGRMIQLQNLKRPFLEPGKGESPESYSARLDRLVYGVGFGSSGLLKGAYGMPVADILGGAIRHVIRAEEGKTLVACDLSSIESVVLGWITECHKVDDTFRNGRDTYKVFASEYYGTPYDEVTKKQRTFAKPPVLGCFAADTQILTGRGWVPIVCIRDQDVVWDGVEWVSHGGVIDQGVKPVIDQHGVRATADHLILTGRHWTEWKDLHGEDLRRATELVAGLSPHMTAPTQDTGAGATAGRSALLSRAPSPGGGLGAASPAQTARLRRSAPGLLRSVFHKLTSTGWRAGTTPLSPDAETRETERGRVTGGEAYGTLSGAPRRSSSTQSHCQGGTARSWKLTASITMATMLRAISGSRIGAGIRATRASISSFFTKAKGTPPQSFGGSTRRGIGTRAPSPGKSRRERARRRSSTGKASAAARTYDILNAGPRSRYTIRTDRGPVIAHNCGYMLGWRGLIAYAEGYGVDMEQADAQRAVDTFRTMYPEIPAFWKWVYSAVMSVTQNGGEVTGYRMRIERDAEFLRIWLPSGRALSYYRPEVRKRAAPWSDKTMTAKAGDAPYEEWLKLGWTDAHLVAHGYMEEVQWLDNFSYMGMNEKNQWTRIYAHAGGMTENVVQSIAGDILWSGIMRAEAAGLPVILHVHDEIGIEVETDAAEAALATLESCMTQQPEWAADMWLGATGFITKRYTKD